MILTTLGDIDRRPLVYTLLRLMSTLHETSVVTSEKKLLVLSDTKKSGGYYLDTQINYVESPEDYDIYVESIFYNNFLYDGITPFFSDIIFYCSNQRVSSSEIRSLNAYNADMILPIEFYSDTTNFFDANLSDNLKKFETERSYQVISPVLCSYLAERLSKPMHIRKDFLEIILSGQVAKKKSILPFNFNLRRKQ